MSRVLDFDPRIRNVQTLIPKNAISYHTSPPYTVPVQGKIGETNKLGALCRLMSPTIGFKKSAGPLLAGGHQAARGKC